MTPEMSEWLKGRMDRIEDKLDSVKDHCYSIDNTLSRNTADIEKHIKRTDGLQDMVDKFSKHLTRVNGIIWFVGFVVTAGGAAKLFGLV
jgi:hypothetical protein